MDTIRELVINRESPHNITTTDPINISGDDQSWLYREIAKYNDTEYLDYLWQAGYRMDDDTLIDLMYRTHGNHAVNLWFQDRPPTYYSDGQTQKMRRELHTGSPEKLLVLLADIDPRGFINLDGEVIRNTRHIHTVFHDLIHQALILERHDMVGPLHDFYNILMRDIPDRIAL